MKFRTILLASAAVMFAGTAAAAEDITAAFYTPGQGKVLSNTTVEYSRAKVDTGFFEAVGKDLEASEEITYGVTDNFAVFGNIANTFNVDKEYNNNHNFDYTVGAKYTVSHDRFLGQVAVAYNTRDPRSWYGKSGEGIDYETNRWEKALEGTVKLGYVLDCGLTPYTTFSANGTIDKADRDQEYSWFLGAHKLVDKVAYDAGIRYDFDSEDEDWFAQAEVDYFVKDNVAVGVFGDYYLGGKGHKDIDYGYTAGLTAKVLF